MSGNSGSYLSCGWCHSLQVFAMAFFGAIVWSYNLNDPEFRKFVMVSPSEIQHIADSISSQNVVLSTCNRIEIYFTLPHPGGLKVPSGAIFFRERDAIIHLFRVAAGLESMSVGENEILSQIKEAFQSAISAGKVDRLISVIFRKAISTGKTVREKTSISRGKTSIPVIAIDIASRHLKIQGSSILVVGTGNMAGTFIRYISKMNPGRITIAGRNTAAGESLASEAGGYFSSMDLLPELVSDHDVIMTATSSKSILVNKSMVRNNRRQVFIDISNPGNIDPDIGNMHEKTIVNLSAIEQIIAVNRSRKAQEIPKAESIIEEEVETFSKKLLELQAEEYISTSFSYVEQIASRELKKFLAELGKGKDADDLSSRMVSSMAKKILSQYSSALRKAALSRDTERMKAIWEAFNGESGDKS